MERDGRSSVITFFSEAPLGTGFVRLGEDAAQHARVRRVRPGHMARILDGRGRTAEGQIAEVGRDVVTVSVSQVVDSVPPIPLELIVPVADRDRMLFAAEKCAELQVTGWRPARFARSRSVSPRGEGEKFHAKVVARMRAALEQSGGAWMPAVHEERDADDVFPQVPTSWNRVILDSSGTLLVHRITSTAMALAVGPEGGFESAELESAVAQGWTVASLGPTTLRFETAIIAAASVVRALQPSSGIPQHG